MKERLKDLIDAFYMVGKPLYIITEQGKIIKRIIRTFKYLDELGIEFECTLWIKGSNGKSNLITNVVHIQEIGKTVFLTREEAEQALKEGGEDAQIASPPQKNNRKMIEGLSDDEWAEAIDRDGFTSLQDKICLEMCPSQDCEPLDSGQCKECIKRWLQKATE